MADTTQKLTQLKYIQRVTGKDSKGKMTLEPMIVGANAYIYTNKNILLTDAKTPTKGFGTNSIYLGTGIKGTEANQLIIGQYNNSTTDIFTIGGGSSATQKKDIFTVSSNGTITQVGDYSGTIGQFRLWGKQKTAGERPMMSIYDGLDGNEDRYKSVGFVDLNEFTTISNGIHLVTQQTVEDNIYQGRGIVQVVGVLQLGTQEDDPENTGQSICVPRLRGANGTVHIGTSDDNDKTTIHGSLEVTGTSDIAGITVGKDLTVAGTFTLGDSENGQESSWGGDIKFYTSQGQSKIINLNRLNANITTLETNITTLQTNMTQLGNSVSDGKRLLASTITTLGVETKEDATFETINTNLNSIFTTGTAVGTATQAQVLSGCTFTSTSGRNITGTMPNNVQYTEVESLGTAQGSGNLFIRIPYGAYLNKTYGENPEVITPLEEFGNAFAFQVLENCSFTSKYGLAIKGTIKNYRGATPAKQILVHDSNTFRVEVNPGYYWSTETTAPDKGIITIDKTIFGNANANKVLKNYTFTSSAGLTAKGAIPTLDVEYLCGAVTLKYLLGEYKTYGGVFLPYTGNMEETHRMYFPPTVAGAYTYLQPSEKKDNRLDLEFNALKGAEKHTSCSFTLPINIGSNVAGCHIKIYYTYLAGIDNKATMETSAVTFGLVPQDENHFNGQAENAVAQAQKCYQYFCSNYSTHTYSPATQNQILEYDFIAGQLTDSGYVLSENVAVGGALQYNQKIRIDGIIIYRDNL